MKTGKKLLLAALLLCVTLGAGVWIGYQIPRGEVDPQDYIETVFTPYDDGLNEILRLLDRAEKSIHIAAYSFTNPEITDRLIEIKKTRPHVEIKVLVDYSQSKGAAQKEQIGRLRRAGIEVVIGKSEASGQIMHHKFIVVDGLWVYSGSWNLSKSANKQANYLDFVYSPRRARLFLDNWQRMYLFMKAHEQR